MRKSRHESDHRRTKGGLDTSTVGAMRDQRGVPTTVGSGRYYETMAFKARQDEVGYWDADPLGEFCIEGRTSLSGGRRTATAKQTTCTTLRWRRLWPAAVEQDYRKPWSAPLTRHST